MKRNLLTSFAGIFLLLLTVIAANGQLAGSMEPSKDFDPLGKSVTEAVLVNRNEVNSKVIKNFVRSYKDVSGEKWFELRDGFIALFGRDNIGYRVAYSKKGLWLHTMRTYDETKLPTDIRHLVKSTYCDYDLTQVQEIDGLSTSLIYVIHLVGKTELINLEISNGEMIVLKTFNKSK